MSAFTILGLLVFWAWCFEIGYYLVPAAKLLTVFIRLKLLERRFYRSLDVFAGWVAAMDKGARA